MRWKAGVLTASDRSFRGERKDGGGPLLCEWLGQLNAEVEYQVLPDDPALIKEALRHMADDLGCQVILTTGGTGLALRDCTPEATREVIEKEVPGIAEALRREGAAKTPFAMLSRSVAGLRGRTLIINLPGSPEAIRDALRILQPVITHAVELLRGEVRDCQTIRGLECRPVSQPTSH